MSLLDTFRLDGERKAAKKEAQVQMDFAQQQNREAIGYSEEQKDYATFQEHQADKSDLLKWQQDFEKDIMEFKFKLLGYKLDGGNWIVQKDEKGVKIKGICNERFIENEFDPIVNAFLNRNAFNTYLSKNEISNLLTNTFLDLGRNLRFKHKHYDIEFKDFDVITRSLKNLAKMGINKAEGGWLKKIDSTMSKRLESIHEAQRQEQQKGFFNLGG